MKTACCVLLWLSFTAIGRAQTSTEIDQLGRPKLVAVPSDSVCGKWTGEDSVQEVTRTELQLVRMTYRPKKNHASILLMRSKQVKRIFTRDDGSFDFGKVEPGIYQIWIGSRPTVSNDFEVVPRVGKKECRLQLVKKGTSMELVTLPEHPAVVPFQRSLT